MSIPIECQSCGATGEVLRVTANLQCRCGSTDLDIYDGVEKTASDPYAVSRQYMTDHGVRPSINDWFNSGWHHGHAGEAPQRAYNHDYLQGYHSGQTVRNNTHEAASGGSGWFENRPDPTSNWSDYPGPTPDYNPNITRQEDHGDTHVCPVCHGTGHDSRASGGGYDETTCRNCHGTGKVVYPTENDQPSLDARVPSGPQLGGGAHGHFGSLNGTSSNATSAATVTWTSAPDSVTYNAPYTVAAGGGGGAAYGYGNYVAVPGIRGNKVVTARQGDKIMAMAATIVEHNSGLTTEEAFELARRAVASFPEDGDK